jgi:hypothetical protein
LPVARALPLPLPRHCPRAALPAAHLLLALHSSIENWDAFAAANGIAGWNTSVPVCTWTGVTCADDGTVNSL